MSPRQAAPWKQRSSIDPVVWHPPPAPPRSRRQDRPTLPPVRLIPVNGLGPETVVVDADGYLLTGLDGGRILRVRSDGREITEVANTGGRPLGIALLPGGGLIVGDAYRGLLRVSSGGDVEMLADRVNGEPFEFCKDVAVAADGTVEVLLDGLQFANGVALGPDQAAVFVAETGNYRLTRYWLDGPKAGTAEPLLTGLPGYPWGLALGSDGRLWVALA